MIKKSSEVVEVELSKRNLDDSISQDYMCWRMNH